ncbi:hypothetical protein [Bifidobacterium myosotis]|uniref:Uncharacterized protein n=1 Tax=Bifidobacterium myosotis TaxID=1630166 RepID=A0A5M9ZFU3_9BIFI|nr:hypothetical protein [Bifidobacterium myosotis]KAA8825102.1 hypothetical protein EMO91_12805 [Bifidobacterium myosotis]
MARRFGFASEIVFGTTRGGGLSSVWEASLHVEETMEEISDMLKGGPAFITVHSGGPKMVNVARIAYIEPDLGAYDIPDDADDGSAEVRVARLRMAIAFLRIWGEDRVDERTDDMKLPRIDGTGAVRLRKMRPFELVAGEDEKVLREAGFVAVSGGRRPTRYRPLKGCASKFRPDPSWERSTVAYDDFRAEAYWF